MVDFRTTGYVDYTYVPDLLGFIPTFLDHNSEEPAKEQLDRNYQHGGGWRKFEGFKWDRDNMEIVYPGDPPYVAIAIAQLPKTKEKVYVFQHAWVLIEQEDGSWEVARMD